MNRQFAAKRWTPATLSDHAGSTMTKPSAKDDCITHYARRTTHYAGRATGSVLVLVVVSIIILSTLGVGLMSVAYGVRHKAVKFKNETAAMLAAEAGYEKAVYWMSQQKDMLDALIKGTPETTGSISFADGSCSYQIKLHTFAGSRPVYKIVSQGSSGTFQRTVDVMVMQAISGWDMGVCRVPSGNNKTTPVYFTTGEIIDMPLHINEFDDSPDARDIYINGTPQFLDTSSMGESRNSSGGADKYSGVMDLFKAGIYFDQPETKVTDESVVKGKVERFKTSTSSNFKFTPTATAASKVTHPKAAVQIEFFVENNVGKVCITNNCTVSAEDPGTRDYMIKSGSGGTSFVTYNIYGYHLSDDNTKSKTYNITSTYVTQKIGGIESVPGGQIFVDGNVIIGGNRTVHDNAQVIKGKITVVATGNIWVADSLTVDGTRDKTGMPSSDNPNVLGLIAQGVVKVVDPGISEEVEIKEPKGFEYVPIGRPDDKTHINKRHLPDPMVVEAAMTIGGGGWGTENVGSRKEAPGSGKTDTLIVRGTITEAVRGVVGLIGEDGYVKQYYMDRRLLEGVLPGDIWLGGKFIPSPAGWHDYRTND